MLQLKNNEKIDKVKTLKRDIDVRKSIVVLQTELSKKETLYDGFVSSVYGCLKDNGVVFLPFDEFDENKLAIAIVDRLAGIE